jgi:hypothetical protein
MERVPITSRQLGQSLGAMITLDHTLDPRETSHRYHLYICTFGPRISPSQHGYHLHQHACKIHIRFTIHDSRSTMFDFRSYMPDLASMMHDSVSTPSLPAGCACLIFFFYSRRALRTHHSDSKARVLVRNLVPCSRVGAPAAWPRRLDRPANRKPWRRLTGNADGVASVRNSPEIAVSVL